MTTATRFGVRALSLARTVVSVEHEGRTARVRTDDGRDVTVHGGGRSPASNSATSVDRRYAVDGRYEFHPINDASPFEDNACTATRQLSGPQPPPVAPADDRLPGWLPIDEQAPPVGYLVFVGALLAMLAVVAAGVVAGLALARRRQLMATGRQGA